MYIVMKTFHLQEWCKNLEAATTLPNQIKIEVHNITVQSQKCFAIAHGK